MPTTRFGRLLFLLIVLACLFVIGRNFYRHRLSERLYAAVERSDLAAARDLVARHADVNYIHPSENELPKPSGAADDDSYEENVLNAAMTRVFNYWRDDPRKSSLEGSVQKAQDAESIACVLVRNGVNLGAHGERGVNYLNQTCSAGRIAIARCLLDRGVDPNKFNGRENNVIDSALGYRYTPSQINPQEQKERRQRVREMVQLLRERGVRLTVTQAVQLGDNALLTSVLEAGESANQKDRDKEPALVLAAADKNEAAVKMLLEHGAEVDAHQTSHLSTGENSISETALCSAASVGSLKIVELLLAHGANVNFQASYTTPLLSAAEWKHSDIFRLLLARGADPNQHPVKPEQGSVLAKAIANLPQFVPELLKRGADPKGIHEDTLPAALRAHRFDLVRELLRRGVPVNPPLFSKKPSYVQIFRDNKQSGNYQITAASPLSIAMCEAPECEELLLRAGAKLGPDTPTILAAAARAGGADLFARLLVLGADVNGMDPFGETPLTQAIMHTPHGVETLLKAGANPNYVNSKTQRLPLDLAVIAGDAATVRLLLAHGANVNAHTPRGHTALYYARKKGKKDNGNAAILALLEKAGATDNR